MGNVNRGFSSYTSSGFLFFDEGGRKEMKHCKSLLVTSTLDHCKAKKSGKPSCAILLSKSVWIQSYFCLK